MTSSVYRPEMNPPVGQRKFVNPHHIPRVVSAISMDLVTGGREQMPHSHKKAQLILSTRGLVTCDVAKGLWLVPAQCALWIPGGLEHSVRAIGDVELVILFLEPDIATGAPAECCTVSISPLLRELVIAVSRLPALYDCDGAPGRLVQTMLDELATAPIEHLHLPLPGDPRLRRIADALAADPSNRMTIPKWAKLIAMSERTLVRMIIRETGMNFSRWRQQFQIMFALERLAKGHLVQSVALDLGYESPSAFITMFKKAMGKPPGKYMATPQAQSAHAKRMLVRSDRHGLASSIS